MAIRVERAGGSTRFLWDEDLDRWVLVHTDDTETGGDLNVQSLADLQSGEVLAEDLTVSDTATYNTVEYSNSNTMKFNQYYLGDSSGSYFTNNEYQKVLTITPSASAQNYLVLGKITAQNGGSIHVVNFEVALRSETLPDLSWSTRFTESYTQQLIKPLLWTKETTTAGFIIAFQILNSTLYGNVTVDVDVVPRDSSQKANVTINNTVSSEQTSVDTGYTSRDMDKIFFVDNTSDVTFDSTGAVKIPVGTTAQRPSSPTVGMIRFNTDNDHFEGYTGSAWIHLDTTYL